ncbi:MAG: hypothetical protein CMK07_06140 [Ponticaulis sp.]|nr:hypothetical protein [Ponticaulis sp.]
MTHQAISALLSGFEEEASSRLGACELVTMDCEQITAPLTTDWSVQVDCSKASSHICFLKGEINENGQTVFTGNAIFRAISASK